MPNATFDAEKADIQGLYQISACESGAIRSIQEVDHAYTASVNDCERLCFYTDGSCQFSRQPQLAHAGWGVVYASSGDKTKRSGPVVAQLQTSYRAELRAIAEVLAICKCPLLICTDCKTIAKQIEAYQTTKERAVDTPAPELWAFIYDIIDLTEDDRVIV